MNLVNHKDYSDDVTDFAQRIIDNTPHDQLDDYWVEYLEILDINIWTSSIDGMIHATAYPIKTDSGGYKETICTLGRILEVTTR